MSSSTGSKPTTGWQPPSLEEMQAMLPQYQFECLLGRGGMGAVYKALQVSLDRPVAIKVLPGDLFDDAGSQYAERFKNEARTMAKMNHPSIVNVYDFGETQTGLLYIVMEFINGTDVAQMIATQGKLPEDYALSITAHVSDALNYAHSHGVIHRDIKPANILINMDGAVKVADFGLAKAHDPGQSGITKTNMAMGTPDFVAPEAFIPGVPLDGRADLYAMGVMLYQMLTGEIPRGIWSLPGKKLGTDPRFDAIITKAMQTDREQRYQSAADLRRDLDTLLTMPRSALVAQQQATAEAAALATQAQKQAASGPQRRPGSAPAKAEPPPVKKSSLGPGLGIAASVLLIAGLAFVMKKPSVDETSHATPPDQAETTPQPAPSKNATPSPSPPPKPMTKPQPVVANSPSPASRPVTPAATASAMPSVSKTGVIDLLALVDVKRDVVVGPWEMTPEGLALKWEKGRAVNVLEFNHSAPEEYDFEIEFTIKKGLSDVSQLLPVKGRTVRWKMGHGFVPLYSFGPNLDGKRADDSERTEAIVKRAHLKSGQRYRSTVQVRKGSLRALIDGEEVLQWSGDLERLGDESSTTVKDRTHPGLGSYSAFVIFHKAELQPLMDSVPVPTPAMPAVASTPAPTPVPTPTPASSSDPHLAKLAAGFTARYESDVQKPYLDAVAALNRSYIVNGIAKARAAAQSRGALNEVVAFDEVKARIERGEGVPAVDEPGTPESLKSLRAIYRNALDKITTERDARAAPLYDIYIRALDDYTAELTTAGKTDEAQKVKTLRDDIALRKPQTATTPIAASKPATEPATPPVVASTPATMPSPPTGGSSWRAAALFLVNNGGSCQVVKSGAGTKVTTEADIPSGRFDITEIDLNRQGSLLPPLKTEDLRPLNSLRELRRFHFRAGKPGIENAAFAFLAYNDELTWLNLEGVPDLTDGVLTHIAPLKKLDYLAIQYATKFTGQGLDKIAGNGSITNLELPSCGITDEGMKAIGSFKRLRNLRIDSTGVTAAGIAAITGIKTLTSLNFSRTAFDDEAAGVLANMPGLTNLDLGDTKITDTGLAKLQSLKKLTSLNLRGSAVSVEAAAELQKAMPQCRVNR